MKGPWTPVSDLPAGFWKLPKDEGWEEVRAQLRGKREGSVPVVFVTTMPAELVVTDGEPVYERIAGTHLLYVSNTDSDLFLHSEEKRHYFLVAGRWSCTRLVPPPGRSIAVRELARRAARVHVVTGGEYRARDRVEQSRRRFVLRAGAAGDVTGPDEHGVRRERVGHREEHRDQRSDRGDDG